jgi:ABC-type glycerol-3-phosphate transport system substrate-binding protein
MNAIGSAFAQEHPGIKFNIQTISWTDAHAKLLAAATSGTGPDLFTGGLSWGIEFGQKGALVDLAKQYPDLATQVKQQAQQGIYNSVVTLDGKLYAAPGDLTVMMMYYRTDIFKQAGIDTAPKTWDELNADVLKIQTAGHKGFSLGWGGQSWLTYYSFLFGAGGSLYDAQCTKATINSDAALKALQYYNDLYTKLKTPTDSNFDFEAGLASGDYPIGFSGNWEVTNLDIAKPEIKGKWAVAPLPIGPAGKSSAFIGGRVMGIMNTSKNQDAAAEFIRFLYTDKAAQIGSQTAAPLNSIWLSPRIEQADSLQIPADRLQALKTQLKDAGGPPNCAGWEESGSTVDKTIQTVILGKADPKKALADMSDAMNQNLKQ